MTWKFEKEYYKIEILATLNTVNLLFYFSARWMTFWVVPNFQVIKQNFMRKKRMYGLLVCTTIIFRVIREKDFNSEEDMKTIQRLQGQIDFQNNKMKALRRTIDDGVSTFFNSNKNYLIILFELFFWNSI